MLQIVALAGVFGFGIVFSLIGALKLELAKVLNIDDSEVGGLVSSIMLSCVVVVLITGLLVDLLGHGRLAVAGFLTASASLFLLISAKSYAVALVACILLGVGGQCINVVGSTLLPVALFGGRNAPAAMNLGTVFYGLGAFITPSLTGILLKRIGYRRTGGLIAALLLVPVVFVTLASYPTIRSGFTLPRPLDLLTNSLILMTSMILFCGIGLQASMGTWITTYGKKVGFKDRESGMILSLFWISLTIGRLAASFWVDPDIGAKTIAALSALAGLTIGMMIILRSKLAAFGSLVAGLTIGPILPTAVGIAFAHAPAAVHGTVFGIIFAIGYLGGSTLPALVGIYCERKSIHVGLQLAIAAAFAVSIFALIVDQGY